MAMTLDTYAICPCGSGKKLKFCCCKDLVHELDKVTRAIEGDQRAAALDQINRLLAEKGKRAALLALKAETLLVLENFEEAEKVNADLLEVMPHGSNGLAIQAILDAVKDNLDSAVERLQESLESIDDKMMRIVYSAIALVGNALLESGKLVAGRGHMLLQATFGGEQDSPAVQSLVRLNMNPNIPVLFKQDFTFAEPPARAPWQGEFTAAMKSARRGAWLAACESLESLNQKAPNQAAIWRNMAILRGWLGQEVHAATAWRTYAALPDVPFDDAVEAEAMANLMQPPSEKDLIDVVKVTYQLTDSERLLESLLSDKRAAELPFDPGEIAAEGEPAPKAAFHLLDRPMPDSLANVQSNNDLPLTIGEIYIFGRQTDREARVEMLIDRGADFENQKREVLQRLGEFAGKFESEQVIDTTSRLRLELNPQRRFPRDSDTARLMQLAQDQRRESYLHRWPEVPQSAFDGKSGREAAKIPTLRNRVAAAILNQELASEENTPDKSFDFNELRRSLELPERGTSSLSGTNILQISLVRMGRLDYSKLSDDELLQAYARLTMSGYRTAMLRCAEQIVSRPSMAERMDLAQVYQTLTVMSDDLEKALKYLEQGRRLTTAKGASAAPWYLLELQIRLARYEAAEAERLIRLISSRFANEPGVAQQLYTLLVRHGVINADGTPTAGRAGPPAARSAVAAEPAAEPASGLWTPDSAAAPAKQESKLWLPGS
jgi:tetratricopeptide (TPR) repeat protein